jgi:hypothetical protein
MIKAAQVGLAYNNARTGVTQHLGSTSVPSKQKLHRDVFFKGEESVWTEEKKNNLGERMGRAVADSFKTTLIIGAVSAVVGLIPPFHVVLPFVPILMIAGLGFNLLVRSMAALMWNRNS